MRTICAHVSNGTVTHVPLPREAKALSDKGDATALITILDTRFRMVTGAATNTNPLWIKGLGIRVPMHRELRSEFENELPSGEVHSVEYMSAVGTWCGSVPGGDAARPMDGIVARLQQCASAWRRSRYRVGRLTPRSTASRTSCCAPRQTTERSPWPFPRRAPRTSSARDCAPEHWRIPP